MEEDPDPEARDTKLVYPMIKEVYYDVQQIKTEPVDREENSFGFEYESTNDYMPFSNKIILGSKPPSQAFSESPSGSSSASSSRKKLFECDQCGMSFATQKQLDCHKTSHSLSPHRTFNKALKSTAKSSIASKISQSFLVDKNSQERPQSRASVTSCLSFSGDSSSQEIPLSHLTGMSSSLKDTGFQEIPIIRQKAVKSTAKSSILNKTYPGSKHKALKNTSKSPVFDIKPVNVVLRKSGTASNSDKLLCNHCDVQFPNEIALIQHTYELIPDKTLKSDVSQGEITSKMNLREHMKDHVKSSKVQPEKQYLRCPYCFCYLRYENRLKQHLLHNHKTSGCVLKRVKFTGKCPLCSRTFVTQKQYNEHISRVHEKIYNSSHNSNKILKNLSNVPKKVYGPAKVKLEPKVLVTKLKPKTHMTELWRTLTLEKLVPKQTLFKCNKCQIHFVTSWSAFDHSKRCVLAKGDWKCNKCRRSFTLLEEPIHTLQHDYSDKFKVHIVTENVLSRVLCRCPKCDLHFDERSFRNHVSSCSRIQMGVHCSICNLKIITDSYDEHRKSHTEYNYTRADYIVIDFVIASVKNDPPGNEVISCNQRNYRHILFCTYCKTNMKRLKDNLLHTSGNCKEMSTKYCLICGLLFSTMSLTRHILEDHKCLNFNLADFIFLTVQDEAVINPPLPDFLECQKCNLRSANRLVIRDHDCATQAFTKCSLCSRKYDPATYKLHLPFHEYSRSATTDRSDTQVTSPSTVTPKSLKFYSCVSCNYGFNSYDNLVEHCQKHYTKSETLTTSACKICNLNYTYGHKNSHSGGMTFVILKFDHQVLLTDNWLRGFDSVSRAEMVEILSASIYGVSPKVRLMLSVDGPPDRTLYKCAKCELCVEPESIVDHTIELCIKSAGYNCTSCTASFRTETSLNKHTDIHVVYGDDIAFRELIFNDVSDKYLNYMLRANMKEESLKLIKCQQCGLFIKKQEYQNHLDSHEMDDSKEAQKLGFRLIDPVKPINKKYIVYQCKDCKSCVMKKMNIQRHVCGTTMKCKKCSLRFRVYFKSRHDRFHSSFPKFVRSNIAVIQFQTNNAEETGIQKPRDYYSEEEEEESLKFKNTILKTYANKTRNDNFTDIDVKQEENDEHKLANTIKENDLTEGLEEVQLMPDLEVWKTERRGKNIYQCERCYFCFTLKIELLRHLSECNENNLSEALLTCNLCDITFHPSFTDFHEKLHEKFYNSHFFLVNISTVGVDLSNNNKWLYKCKFDGVHFLTMSALDGHFENNHTSGLDFVNCSICKLKFTVHTRTKHVKLHHTGGGEFETKFNIAVAEKKTVKMGVMEVKRVMSNVNRLSNKKANNAIDTYDNKKANNAIDTYDNSSKTSNIATEDVVVKADIELSEKRKGGHRRALSVVDNTLYKCTVCSIHFLKKHTLKCHVRYKRHCLESTHCDVCGLKFGVRTLDRHKLEQHDFLNLQLKDFVITTDDGDLVDYEPYHDYVRNEESNSVVVNNSCKEENPSNVATEVTEENHENNTLSETTNSKRYGADRNSISFASSIDRDDPTQKNLKGKAVVMKNKIQVFRLYQCKDCRVCVQKTQRKLHVCCSDIQKKYCIKCSIPFRRTDFRRHMSMHKKHLDLSRKNFTLTKFGRRSARRQNIYKCVICSTHFLTWTALEWHMEAYNHQTKKVECKTCGLHFGKSSLSRHTFIHHTMMNLTNDQFNIICVSTLDKSLSSVEEVTSNRLGNNLKRVSDLQLPIPNTKSAKKLFKCFECDLHFLMQRSYYHHMYKHIRLDATEFIACKICDLQFLTEELRDHMKSHRNNTFKLDNLLIQGYQPNTNELIENYFASVSLNSKLVSTTTPFDNDVEAVPRSSGEQLSTVDSTSDGVSKSDVIQSSNG